MTDDVTDSVYGPQSTAQVFILCPFNKDPIMSTTKKNFTIIAKLILFPLTVLFYRQDYLHFLYGFNYDRLGSIFTGM